MANPFDQFGAEFQAALPSNPPPPAPGGGGDDSNPFASLGGAPAPPPPGPPPAYGQPPPPQQMPPQQQPPMYGGMPPGQPPQQAPPASGMPPAPMPPQSNDPFGGPPANMGMGQPPAQAPPQNDPFAGYGQQPPPPQMMQGGGMMGQPQPPSMNGLKTNSFDGNQSVAQQSVAPSVTPSIPQGAPPGAPPADPFSSFGAPPPAGGPPQQPPPQPPAGGPPQNDPFGGYGMGAPPAPQPDQNQGFGAPPPAQAPPAANDPFGGFGMGGPPSQPPPQQPPQQQAPPPPQQQNDPWGAPQQQQPPQQPPPPGPGGYDPSMGALVPSTQQSQPYALPPQQQPPYGAPPPPGQQQFQQQPPPPQQAPPTDPFSVFNSEPAPAPVPPAGPPPPGPGAMVPAHAPPQQQYQQPGMPPSQPPPPQQAPPQSAGDDFFADMGFDTAPAAGNVMPAAPDGQPHREPHQESKDDGLPPGGEWYDARIFTPTLGVMFFKPQELTDSLFLNTDRSIVDGLGERPVVAFIVEGSSARSAGVELGHVLLKVNGVDVKNPKEASRLIKEGPRPLPLLFYVPNTEVVVAEGEHMVKYDTRETTAPNSAKEWKPKYVVIGGIIAQPWMMNMYRSKSEYDIAVIETQARRPVSVKVKQFSLQGARIQNDWQGPQMVKYKNKLHPWKYIVILPVARNPIKISSPNLSHLKPVHEGIRRVLLAQQRDRGGSSNTAAPRARDPYGGGRPVGSGGDQYGQQQQQY